MDWVMRHSYEEQRADPWVRSQYQPFVCTELNLLRRETQDQRHKSQDGSCEAVHDQ